MKNSGIPLIYVHVAMILSGFILSVLVIRSGSLHDFKALKLNSLFTGILGIASVLFGIRGMVK